MEQTPAASSPAEAVDPFNGETPSLDEFNHYRATGDVPARFKPADAAAAATDTPEQTVEPAEDESPEDAPDSEPEQKPQEPPQKPISPAEKRIKQLLAEKKELERKLAETARTDAKPAPSAAQNQLQPQPQYTRAKPKPDANGPDGKPYETYEDYVEDLAKWSGEQQLAQYQRGQAEQQALHALQTKLDDARSRYEDADDTIFPTAQAIRDAQIPLMVKQVIEESDVFVDLCYVMGSDPEELTKFIALARRDPRAAIGMAFEYERGIKEAFKNGSGTAPEKKKTQAPPPPTPVGGSASRGFDVNDDSLSPDDWFQKRNAQLAKRRA